MATGTTSIGSNSSIDTETPSSCSAVSDGYEVTFATDPTGVSVGDICVFTDEMTYYGDFTYLVTAISGSTYTLRYITDDSAMGDDSPCSLMDSSMYQASGTFKRCYSTITAWEADLDNSDYYSSGDDAVGECHADSTFVEAAGVQIAGGGTVGLSSVTLTAHIDSRHDGTKGSGVVWQNADSTSSAYHVYLNNDNITVSWLELDGNDARSHGIAVQAGDVHITNNLIYDFHNSSGVLVVFYFSDCCPYVTNNFIWNMTRSGSGLGAIFYSTGTTRGFKGYNNTIYHVDFGSTSGHIFYNSWGDNDTKVRNLVLMDYENASLSNVSKDAGAVLDYWGMEATDSNVSDETIDTVANTFVDSTVSDPDLHLKECCLFVDAGVDLGTSPTNVNIDIDGRDRDSEGDTWDIGADESLYSPCSDSSTQKRKYLDSLGFSLGLDG